jgi:hypothetical protein
MLFEVDFAYCDEVHYALMIQSLPAALQNNLAVTSKLSILKQEATL